MCDAKPITRAFGAAVRIFVRVSRAGKVGVGEIGKDDRGRRRGTSRGGSVERRRILDLGIDGGGDCVDLGAEEQVAN